MTEAGFTVVVPDFTQPEAAALLAEYYRDALPLIESTRHCHEHGWIGEEAAEYWSEFALEWGRCLTEVGARHGRLAT